MQKLAWRNGGNTWYSSFFYTTTIWGQEILHLKVLKFLTNLCVNLYTLCKILHCALTLTLLIKQFFRVPIKKFYTWRSCLHNQQLQWFRQISSMRKTCQNFCRPAQPPHPPCQLSTPSSLTSSSPFVFFGRPNRLSLAFCFLHNIGNQRDRKCNNLVWRLAGPWC